MQQDLLQVSKDAALKAHSEGEPSIKKLLETMYPTVFAPPKRNWQDVTTLEMVCEEMGEDSANYQISDNVTIRQRGVILFSILQLIYEYFRQGVVLDYADEDQGKHYPWGRCSAGSGFSLGGVGYDSTGTGVGARLSADDEDKVRHIWKHFNHYIQDFWQWK